MTTTLDEHLDRLAVLEGVPLAERDLATTTYALLVHAAERWPDATAGVWIPDPADLERHLTTSYRSLLYRVHAIGHVLHRLGVRRPDAVTLVAPNSSDLLAATLAAEAVGIAAPVNPALEAEHLRHVLGLTGSRVMVTAGPEADPELWQRMAEAAPGLGIEVLVALDPDLPSGRPTGSRPPLTVAGGARAVRLAEVWPPPVTGLPAEPPRPDDLAAFFHTGGTTGAPKVAAHTHRNQAVTAWAIASAGRQDPGEGIVAGLPLFHVNALLVTGLAPMVTGGHPVWPSPLGYRDPALYAAFWRLVERFRPVAMSAVPTVYAFLAATPVDADLASLRFAAVGAAPLPDAVRHAFRERTGLELHEGYGLTEATCASSVTRPDDVRPGCVGMRLPYQRVVAGEVGEAAGSGAGTGEGVVRVLPPGEVGELLVAGPAVFAGYLRRVDGERTVSAAGVVVDGWLRTGDLGHVVEDRVHLHGRLKDLIIRGGHNIDPAVIEEALLSHPAVTGAAAVGRPDRSSGEVPVAFVSLAAVGTGPVDGRGPVDGSTLVAWAYDRISERAAAPRTITVLPSLPLTEVGKPFKPALRELAAAAAFRDDLAGTGVEVAVHHRDGRLTVLLTGPAAALPGAAALLDGYGVGVDVEVAG